MFAASKDTDIPFIFSEPQFSPGFEGNALSGNGEKCIECRKESRCDCRYCGAYNHTNACPWLATSFPATPANCDAHDGRFVDRFGQIALVSFLRFLRQIERCLRKSLPAPFSSRSLSARRVKAA